MRTFDAEQALAILHNIRGYAIVTLKPDGEIVDWLADAEAVTRLPSQEAVGRNIADIYTASDRAACAHLEEMDAAWRDGRAEDSRWHVRADGHLFWANGLTFPLNDQLLVKIFRDETKLKKAEEQRILLLNELNHRVKNTLATVHSVAEQTLRAAGVDANVRADLVSRLHALSRAHDVLVNNNWAGADLGQIVADAMAPYEAGTPRIDIDGPGVRLHPSQAVTLALVLHELATNAAKYGALSPPSSGRVRISWNGSLDAAGRRHLSLLWKETGGPEVKTPARTGFGSKLIRQAAGGGGGSVDLRFPPDGVTCVLSLTLIDDGAHLLLGPDGGREAEAV